MLVSFRKSFSLLVALTAILFAGNAQALINSTATDGIYSNKVVHTIASGGSCTYVNYNHYELYYRKLPTETTWTMYKSQYVPGGYYYLWAEDTGGTPGKTYDYYMEVGSPSLYLWCNGYTDRGWANNPPTATSASLPGSTIGGAQVCAAPSVTDPNLNQPDTTSPDTFTYSIVSQPATGTASIVSNQVCYTPPASGPTQNYSFTIKVTDKVGNTVNGTASGTVTNPTPPPSKITGLIATDGTVTNAINVSWPASSYTNSYDVYRSTVSGQKGTYIGSTASTAYSDPISTTTLYYYTVTPKNINGPGPDSNQDVGWANVAPTATSAAILAVVGGTQQCVTPSVTDANNPQGENYTFSVLSQPTKGTASIVSNKVCYTPPASGAGSSYAFSYRVTDKGGATFNGSANVNVSGAIQNVYATQGTLYGKSTVSWTGDPTAANYDIYRSTSVGTKGSLIGTATGTGFDDTTVSGTTHYFYTVVAKNSAGSTPDSAQAEGWGKIPSAISDLTATKGILQNKVGLSWSKNPDATGYEVWRSITSGGISTKIATLGTMAIGYYEDTTVSGMTPYFYTVKAVVGSTISQPSNEAMGYAIVATSKVTGATATQGTFYGKSTVSWTADPAAANYDIYRSTAAGTQGSIVSSNVTETSFDDITVSGTTHYFYTVVAKNSVGSSPDSAQAEGWGKIPSTISDLTATKGTLQNKVGLSWSKNSDATGYEVWRSTTSGGASTQIATLGTMATGYYEDTTVSGMTPYFYTVKAVVGSTISQPSNEAMGYAIVATSKVTGATATQGTFYGKSTVSWTADPAAANYDIYRSTAAGTQGSIVSSNVTETSFDDITVSGTTHYFYTVVAKNSVGSSPDSDQAEGWGKMPGVVSDLTASQGTLTNKVGLNWSAVVDATGYEVWRTSTSGGSSTKIATLTASASSMDDTTVSGVASYFYTVKTIIGLLKGSPSIEAEGWANAAPTEASATLTTTSTEPSLATPPTIIDPNITAGKTETYSLSITTSPATGTLAIVDNKFVYTPPADGLYSGTLTFEFSATDKGGETITGNGIINVICNGPSISSFTLPQSSILQATAFETHGTYSLPACSANGNINVDVFDSDNNIVSSGSPISTSNGENIDYTFTNGGLINTGTYTVRMTAFSNSGTDSKTATLTVTNVNLPVLSISPSLNITVGEETVAAALSNPTVINCPFTNDAAAAQADPDKCYVVLVNPPPGMTVDNSGTLPSMSGTIEAAGSFPITAEVHKFDGSKLVKIGEVSKTVAVACAPPVISSLDIPALFSYEEPNYSATYKAYACNAPLSGTLIIKNGTATIETKTLSSLDSGVGVPLTLTGSGLPAGSYTAQLNITGSSGTGIKTRLFAVKNPPMPVLLVSPTTIYQSETRVDASIQPSADNSCPITSVQSEAEADPRKCYVSLTTTLSDMNPGSDNNGLPTLYGHPGIPGDYLVQALISRWVKGTRYDSEPLIKNITVIPVAQPTFKFTGKTDIYVGIEKLSLIFAHDSGLTCNLYDNPDTAQAAAANGNRVCIASFSGDSDLTKSFLFNQYKFVGPLTSVGPRTLSYVVSRLFADGMTLPIQSGDLTITVKDLPPPTIKLKGGYKITEGKYYVPLGQAITRATILAGVQTNAKMKITVTDSQQSFERGDVLNESSYWINTPNLALLEERPVTLRVAWQDFPSIFSEQVITAVGGTESNMKLVVEAPQKIPDTQIATIKVKVGKYSKTGISYTPDTMGQWRTQIFAQANSQSVKTPITEMKDMVNGEAEFQINPAGNLFMKLTAVSELVSNVDGLDTTLTSWARYIDVVKGSPIEGTITSKSIDGPAPKTFTLNLNMTPDNRVALKEVSWEESTDAGVTWTAIEKSNTIRHNVAMQDPGRRLVRAKMINKNTLVENYATPVEVWAYSTLEASITGPRHMAPGYAATLAAELYREGVLTSNTVNEWTIEAPSGTTTTTGATATITAEQEGKMYVTLRTRPADTRADDPSAWSVARHYLIVKTPTRPSVSTKGQRDVETGKTYHYDGSVRPSWGGMVSVHTTKSEWQKPDGSLVSGDTLDWTPTPQDMVDTKPLIFRAWVDGFKDTTTKETTVSYVPWQYVWPNFTMSMKQLTVQAPSDIILMVNHDRPEMNRRFEGLSYEWSFPANVNGRQNDAFPNRAAGQVVYAGEYDVTVTIRDGRGHKTVLTQHIVAEQAVPYTVTLKLGKSNYYDRAPMTVTVRPTIYGGHPLDSVVGQLWKVDGIPVDEFTNRSYMVSNITDAGNHVVSYTLNSKMGETTTVNSPLNLVQNQPPVCELMAKPSSYVVYVEAKCTDPDGKVIGYAWEVNGQPIGSTSYRISFSKTTTPQSASATITGMDDAKELSTPVSINVAY